MNLESDSSHLRRHYIVEIRTQCNTTTKCRRSAKSRVMHPHDYLGLNSLTGNVTNFIAGGGNVIICEVCLRIWLQYSDIVDGAIIGKPEIISNLLSNVTVIVNSRRLKTAITGKIPQKSLEVACFTPQVKTKVTIHGSRKRIPT